MDEVLAPPQTRTGARRVWTTTRTSPRKEAALQRRRRHPTRALLCNKTAGHVRPDLSGVCEAGEARNHFEARGCVDVVE